MSTFDPDETDEQSLQDDFQSPYSGYTHAYYDDGSLDEYDDDEDYSRYYDENDYEQLPDPTRREIWASSELTLREKIAMIASGWWYTLKHRVSWWWRWEFRHQMRKVWHRVRTGKPYEDEIPF